MRCHFFITCNQFEKPYQKLFSLVLLLFPFTKWLSFTLTVTLQSSDNFQLVVTFLSQLPIKWAIFALSCTIAGFPLNLESIIITKTSLYKNYWVLSFLAWTLQTRSNFFTFSTIISNYHCTTLILTTDHHKLLIKVICLMDCMSCLYSVWQYVHFHFKKLSNTPPSSYWY